MSGKKIFQIDPENWPNQTTRERVVSERGRKELPPGTKGGENLKPDRHPWEYTTFPVGGAVILIEDDGLAEALLGLSQEDLEIFMMHWFLRMTDAQIARYINMPRRTVNTRRHKAYRLLTELMGGEADD